MDRLESISNTSITVYNFMSIEEGSSILLCQRKSYVKDVLINVLNVDGHAIYINEIKG